MDRIREGSSAGEGDTVWARVGSGSFLCVRCRHRGTWFRCCCHVAYGGPWVPAEEDPFGRGRVQLSSWVVWEGEAELRGFEREGGCSGDSGRILRGQGRERDTGRRDLTWDPRRETGSPRHDGEGERGNIPRGNGDSGTRGAEEGRRRPVGGKGPRGRSFRKGI